MSKFGVVILNYKTPDETITCANSVLKCFEGYDFEIIIIENGSSDDSFIRINTSFRNCANIHIIISNENLGFARGMNLGIHHLNNSIIKPDFIILLNNDTKITEHNWPRTLIEKYKQYAFAVAGPDIINSDGRHINPSRTQANSIRDLRRLIKARKMELFLETVGLRKLYCKIKQLLKQIIKHTPNNSYLFESTNVQLQGSCLILSKSFFNKYDELFPYTFLYFEEAILKYYCDSKKMIMLYTPEIKISHNHAVATNLLFSNQRDKLIFNLRNKIKSCTVFLRWLEENKVGENELWHKV